MLKIGGKREEKSFCLCGVVRQCLKHFTNISNMNSSKSLNDPKLLNPGSFRELD